MSNIARFGVSLEKNLLSLFDQRIKEKKYTNRSEAIRDLIRDDLIKKQWAQNELVAGAITIIYDHHKRELVNKLMDIQHNFSTLVISTQHVHLSHDICLEVVVVKGAAQKVQALADTLKAVKDVKHTVLSMTSAGEL